MQGAAPLSASSWQCHQPSAALSHPRSHPLPAGLTGSRSSWTRARRSRRRPAEHTATLVSGAWRLPASRPDSAERCIARAASAARPPSLSPLPPSPPLPPPAALLLLPSPLASTAALPSLLPAWWALTPTVVALATRPPAPALCNPLRAYNTHPGKVVEHSRLGSMPAGTRCRRACRPVVPPHQQPAARPAQQLLHATDACSWLSCW